MHELDELTWRKENGYADPSPAGEPIVMPNNTSAGLIIGGFTFVLGFALTWHIWWLAILSLVVMVATLIIRGSDDHPEHLVSLPRATGTTPTPAE